MSSENPDKEIRNSRLSKRFTRQELTLFRQGDGILTRYQPDKPSGGDLRRNENRISDDKKNDDKDSDN